MLRRKTVWEFSLRVDLKGNVAHWVKKTEKSSQPSFNLTYIHHHFHASCSPAGVEVCLSLSKRVTARDFVCGGGECQSALPNLIANAELDGIIVEAKVCRFSRTGL